MLNIILIVFAVMVFLEIIPIVFMLIVAIFQAIGEIINDIIELPLTLNRMIKKSGIPR